jgi:GrpB-like predicted nucleotidyltransferase (UPF0157 family)
VPPPIKVELVAHDPLWAAMAASESWHLGAEMGKNLLVVHHIGSTAIPGIKAKPIIDLMPIVRNLDLLDQS